MLCAQRPVWVACVLAAVIATVVATPVSGTPGAAAADPSGPPRSDPPQRLTIDRLYSLPSLIGTAPTGFAWSPDGRRLAFLWTDEGFNFRDVWVLDVENPDLSPRRLTRMPRPSSEATETTGADSAADPVALARARERSERAPGVTSVIWHPDGESLLVSFAGDLWHFREGSEPLRLTETEPAERQASFSPDGGELAFLRGGDLWLMTVDSGSETDADQPTTAQITHLASDEARISSFRWSPDGSRIALLEGNREGVPLRGIPDYLAEETALVEIRRAYPGDEPTRQRIGILTLGDGEAATPGGIEWLDLTTADSGDAAPDMLLGYRWSPDASRLAVDTSDLYAKDRRVFVVDLAGGDGDDDGGRTARVVARDLDPENETFYFWRIAWSVDSSRLYFLSDRADDYHVWAVDPAPVGDTRPPERLTRGPWAVAAMHPVEDGLVVVGNRGNAEQRHLFFVADGGGEPIRLSRRPGTHAPVVAPDGRHAAVAFSSDSTPPDLLLTRLETGPRREDDERRITSSPLPVFSSYRWVTPRYVSFPSHVDGTTLHGRLTLPPDFDPEKTYPAILGSVYTDSVRNQWGGRTAHPTWGLDQYLAQEGYVLLNVDMRGSWGRGREHRRGIRLDYGGMDIDDLESGVRFLAAEGHIEMDRVGIWGSSYGGLMAAMSLFRKPGLYAAGVAAAPATNVWHALTGQMAVMMRPEDQPEEYADSSPYLHAHGLEDPLLIIHGMRDRVVLFKDSVILVDRLIRLGKDVDLVALPDAGHGWDNEGLAQTRFAFRKLVDHFNRHLKGSAR